MSKGETSLDLWSEAVGQLGCWPCTASRDPASFGILPPTLGFQIVPAPRIYSAQARLSEIGNRNSRKLVRISKLSWSGMLTWDLCAPAGAARILIGVAAYHSTHFSGVCDTGKSAPLNTTSLTLAQHRQPLVRHYGNSRYGGRALKQPVVTSTQRLLYEKLYRLPAIDLRIARCSWAAQFQRMPCRHGPPATAAPSNALATPPSPLLPPSSNGNVFVGIPFAIH